MTEGRLSPSREAGFTLLELLVALALMAVIGTTMAAAVTQLRPMQMAHQNIEEREAAATIINVIARDINAAARLPLVDGGSSTSKLFIGAPQTLTFSAVVVTGFQRRALREVTYEVIHSSDGAKLLRRTRMRRFSEGAGSLHSQVDELWSGEFRLRMQYLAAGDGKGLAWHDNFDMINALPRAVSISLALRNAGGHEIMTTVTLSNAIEN